MVTCLIDIVDIINQREEKTKKVILFSTTSLLCSEEKDKNIVIVGLILISVMMNNFLREAQMTIATFSETVTITRTRAMLMMTILSMMLSRMEEILEDYCLRKISMQD